MSTATIDKPTIDASIDTVGIPVGKIDPSPFNPRRHFDPAELKRLGESLKTDGQLQNCVVRHKGHRYELIAGERRWRAAKDAGLSEVRCVVVEADDERAVELAGMENYQRQQLDAVEVARWFKSMIEQAGYSQAGLAKRLNITQGLVSQRLGLLELPGVWQERIITGVIPATWGRELVRWVKRPNVLERLDHYYTVDPPETPDEFRHLLSDAVHDCSRPLSGWFSVCDGNGVHTRSVQVAFKVSSGKRRELLDIEEFQVDDYQGKRKIKRAFNVALWDEYQEAALKRRGEQQAKKQTKLEQEAATAKTPAKKRAAKKKANDQFAKRLYHWKIQYLQGLIVEKIPTVKDDLILRLLLHFTVQDSRNRSVTDLYDAISASKATDKQKRSRRTHGDTIGDLVKLEDVAVRAVAVDLLQSWFKTELGGYRSHLTAVDIESMAVALKIDLAKEWKLTRDYLDLHTKEQLFSLAREWKLAFHASKRGELIDGILKANPTTCPAELLKVKG